MELFCSNNKYFKIKMLKKLRCIYLFNNFKFSNDAFMKKTLLILFLLSATFSFSQGIIVDNTTLSVPQLVSNELLQNSCSNETNFIFSDHIGIGQFTNTNPGFPITSGIIIRNGNAKNTEGIYTGLNESSQTNTNGDADLQAISTSTGQAAPITDVAFVQFDFTPLSSNFSFDFIFASNEYGEFQCGFSDVFAFLLTDLTTGVTTNLAVLPGTTTPVSVKNIRDGAYNPACLSVNPNLFSRYNVTNAAVSAINMRGETTLLTATSPVTPNRTYRIKLAIGDYLDSNYDSAVFIKGGSFITSANLGPDRTMCTGETVALNGGLGPGYSYTWEHNGVIIPGATNATYNATQTGTYEVTATLGGCVITDEVEITALMTSALNNITVCNTGQATYQFNLLQNDQTTLGVSAAEYTLMYFSSLANANANGPQIPVGQLSSYTSAPNQTIYVKLVHTTNGNSICSTIYTFNLLIGNSFVANTPPNLRICGSATADVPVDLTTQNAIILGAQNPANYNITFYNSQNDAQISINAIPAPDTFTTTMPQSPQTIWVRVEDITNPNCFKTVNFTITIFPRPPVDSIDDVIECSSYTLPPITDGNYYTGSNGSGTLLHAGDVINTSGTYYIFNGPIAPNGCTRQSNFLVTLIDELIFPQTGCGTYAVPIPPAGDFFTGPGGTGTIIPDGTILLTSQTIYYYAVINGVVCRDERLDITIFPLPPADNPADVFTCNSYTLPPLTNGNYFSGSEGTGTPMNAGDIITSTQTIYVFADDGRCTTNNAVDINIIDTSIYQPVTACGSFVLPDIPFGSYHTLPAGGGATIAAGTAISTSQTVYYFAVTNPPSNCTDNLNYQITINPLPPIDTPADRLECESYTLPPLTNGNYFTDTNGGGTPLFAGDVITATQTIYVYVANGTCTNEHPFEVEIRPLPLVDSPLGIFACGPYTLPPLVNGKYYTATNGPHGLGHEVMAGTVIFATQTLYIYSEWDDFRTCSNEIVFLVEINNINVGTFDDVAACESYTLPNINVGNYYSQPAGQGAIIPEGTVLTTSQTVYVYEIVGTRITCSDEDDFVVTISTTPVLAAQPDIAVCGNYVLPPLVEGNYFADPDGRGTPYFAGDTITESQNMWVYATAPNNPNCNDQTFFFISIYPLNNLNINDGVICVDFNTGTLLQSAELQSGLNPATFTVDWYLNNVLVGTGPNYTATVEGDYSVIVTKNIPDVGNNCGYNNPTIVRVEKSSTAIATVTVTAAFENIIDIIVNVTGGFGTYEYQLDNGPFQSDPVFHNVASGEHLVTVRDTKGNCGDIVLIASVLKYPNFFTPNADGNNDTWNIWDIQDQPDAIINIFDRYGKFLYQFSPTSPGWDGTHNGQELPSTDYWFQVFYTNNGVPQEFKSHFSMKR